ncbi:histidine kinase [Peptostreptococcus anaerobius]|uniref:histidine kinase n=1 Tax=Peptostreptococcus TaxID=1257 RepID=UPI00232B67D1|nr:MULTISPECIES: histidine kinase [Peptostreptococcus]MDB8822057.1 histidine kinase [Peptostreptococcus anaerobius]MDB8826686.1 histidine kinase [Peptostreptococcus anaerobius]MDB8828583.1 histidine kinase [Peptostreptococcus anaerobius]MDB8830387.1 histidine kinase [Peptostreptococcus anaerobius]MDB8832221.1 histidine kinase [Peptostreptococcus anaerobius]
MGLLFNTSEEITDKVLETFDDKENYLVVFKHNDTKTDLFKWLAIGGLYYTTDSSRSFILNFSHRGIYEVEISNGMKKNFLIMPWNEISSFEVVKKNKKAIITLVHVGKKVSYEVPFTGKIAKGNEERFAKLEEKEWNRIE